TSQSFQNLVVTSDSIIDFGEGSSLNISNYHGITIAAGATLTIANWNRAADSTFKIGVGYDPAILPRIIFEGFEGSLGTGGFITPGTPVPEPAAFGLVALGSLTAFSVCRRRRLRPSLA